MLKQHPQLLNDDFKLQWDKVLKTISEYRLNEVVLAFITRKRSRIANAAQDLNVQAAIDLWKQEGALEVWEFIKTLTEPADAPKDLDDEEYLGDL